MTGKVSEATKVHGIDTGKRHLLTPTNLAEMGITWDVLKPLLNDRRFEIDGQLPIGISINEMSFGDYPSGSSASSLGWTGYMTIGVPLIEERSNIIQPAADVLSSRTYVNRAAEERNFSDNLEFTISNTLNWSLAGTGQVTFGASASASMQNQIQQNLLLSFQQSASTTAVAHSHKDNIGPEFNAQGGVTANQSATTTGTGSSTGTGEVKGQLMLGITGSVGGSLTTSWKSSSSVSGSIPASSRVETVATQRRQVKQFIYELPIGLAGFVALHYPKEVRATYLPNKYPYEAERDDPVRKRPYSGKYNDVWTTPQSEPSKPQRIIAVTLSSIGLTNKDQPYITKGIAESVSSLNVEHTILSTESIATSTYVDSIGPQDDTLSAKRPHYL